MFRFAVPAWLALLPIPVAIAWWTMRRRAEPALPLPSAIELAPGLAAGPWTRLSRMLPALRALALSLGLVALARPQAGERRETVSSFGVDVVVALDVSGSMRCEDTRPRNRLDVARDAVARFVDGRPSDRIGLVAFGSMAATRCPLSLDHEMVQELLREIDFAPQGEEGTAIGTGLGVAVNRLRESKSKSKVVVLVTDGRSNQGPIDPDGAAAAAKALGVRVYCVGVGGRGEVACPQMTSFGKRYVMRREDLDEPQLQHVASVTGGRYFRAADAEGMQAAFGEIDRLEKTEVESRVRLLYDERFDLALMPAGGLLLVELLLAATRLRRIP